LDRLKAAFLAAPETEVEAAYQAYRLRRDQILDGCYLEMERRADLLYEVGLDGEKIHTPRVWQMVDRIREVAGDREGDKAAKFATQLIEPLMRQKKALADVLPCE
jgi:hypothetical protein